MKDVDRVIMPGVTQWNHPQVGLPETRLSAILKDLDIQLFL